MKIKFTCGALVVLLALSVSNSVFAQDRSSETPPIVESRGVVGLGISYGPEYLGAFKKRVRPAFFADYQNKNGFFISPMRGIGMSQTIDKLTLSTAIGYRPGRQDSLQNGSFSSSDYLKGLGDIPGAVTANLQVATRFSYGIKASLGSNIALSKRETGNLYQFGLSLPIYGTKTDQVIFDSSLVYGDGKYNQTYFGVTPRQSQLSAFKSYQLDAGFNQFGTTISWTHVISESFSVRTSMGAVRILGDSANSPIVVKETSPRIVSTFNYLF